MTNAMDELSVLTNINSKILNKIVAIEEKIIADALHTSIVEGRDTTKVDIGIGVISIFIDSVDNSIKFNFSPDAKLVEDIKENIRNGKSNKSTLQEDLEDKLVAKLLKTYKEIL